MKENMKKTIAALSAAAVMLAASASIYACSNGSLAGRFGAKDTSVPAASEQSEAQGSAAAGSSENAHGPFGNAPAGMKGGLFYKLTKAPRYAFKELKALGFLDKEADPWKKISGQDAVNLFNVCVNYAEASR